MFSIGALLLASCNEEAVSSNIFRFIYERLTHFHTYFVFLNLRGDYKRLLILSYLTVNFQLLWMVFFNLVLGDEEIVWNRLFVIYLFLVRIFYVLHLSTFLWGEPLIHTRCRTDAALCLYVGARIRKKWDLIRAFTPAAVQSRGTCAALSTFQVKSIVFPRCFF